MPSSGGTPAAGSPHTPPAPGIVATQSTPLPIVLSSEQTVPPGGPTDGQATPQLSAAALSVVTAARGALSAASTAASTLVSTSPAAAAIVGAGAAALTALAANAAAGDPYGIAYDLAMGRAAAAFASRARSHALANNSVADMWAETVAATPGSKPAMVFGGRAVSIAQVDERSNQLAWWLSERGLARPRSVVALVAANSPRFVIAWLACAKVGAAVALINTGLKPPQMAHSLAVAKPGLVLFDSALEDTVHAALRALAQLPPRSGAASTGMAAQPVQLARIDSSTLDCCSGGDGEPVPAVAPASVSVAPTAAEPAAAGVLDASRGATQSSSQAYPRSRREGVGFRDLWGFVYTSGTTGLPKAASLTCQRFFLMAYLLSTIAGVGPSDVVYTALPLFHSAGGAIGIGTLITRGCTVIVAPRFSASAFWSDCVSGGATVVQYIGELCRYLVAAPPSPFEARHCVRIAIGNGLRPDVWRPFQERFRIPVITEFYASTEGNGMVMRATSHADTGAVGRFGPLSALAVSPPVIAQYDDEAGALVRTPAGLCVKARVEACPRGTPGELLMPISAKPDLTGMASFNGYKDDPEATARKIARDVCRKGDAYFRTGDLLKQNPDGRFYFVDRIGDTFRWKGENVATTEVAEAITSFGGPPGVTEAIVYGVEVPGYDGRAGMAALVLAPPQDGARGSSAGAGASSGSGSLSDWEALDWAPFLRHLRGSLAPFAIPLFLRLLAAPPVTETLKHVKHALRTEGADPTAGRVRDPLLVLHGDTYVPLTPERWHALLVAGGGPRRL